MKTISFKGTVEEYQGNKLDTPIAYDGTCEQYENLTEAKSSEDWPGDSEILKFVNTKKLTAAKSAEYQKQTKELKDAWEKSPAKARKDFIDSFMKAPNATMANAEAMADSIGLTGK